MPAGLCELTQVFRPGELRCSELWSRAGLMTKLPGMIDAVCRRFLCRQDVEQTAGRLSSVFGEEIQPVSQSVLCLE